MFTNYFIKKKIQALVSDAGGVRIVPFPWMRHVRFWSCII